MTCKALRFPTLALLIALAQPAAAQMTDPEAGEVPGPRVWNTPGTKGGGSCGVDQSSLSENALMAVFSQPDLAQSFTPALNGSCGARLMAVML